MISRIEILEIIKAHRLNVRKDDVVSGLIDLFGYSEENFKDQPLLEVIENLTSEEFVDLSVYTGR